MESTPTKQRIKAFIDSSTLYAAAVSSTGPARELLLRGLRGDLDLVISPLVLEETERNLLDKAPAAVPAFKLFRDVLVAQQVSPSKPAVLRVAKVVNPKDAPIVAAAMRAHVDYLATHDDRTLLRFKREIEAAFGLKVVEPHEILFVVRAG